MSLLLLFNQEAAEPVVGKSIPAYWIHGGIQGGHEIFVSTPPLYFRPAGRADIEPSDPDFDLGWPALRAGSITGLAFCAADEVDTSSDPSFVHLQVRKNNSVVFEMLKQPPGAGNVMKSRLLQDPGIDIFVPGDILTMSLIGGTGVQVLLSELICVMEVMFADLGGGAPRRAIVYSGHNVDLSTFPTYLRPAGRPDYGTQVGTPVMRDCSIVGVTCTAEITSHSANGTLTIEVRKNDVLAFSATSPTITGNGTVSWAATQDAGIDTLDADVVAGPDVIQTRLVRDSGTFSARPMVTVELEVAGP